MTNNRLLLLNLRILTTLPPQNLFIWSNLSQTIKDLLNLQPLLQQFKMSTKPEPPKIYQARRKQKPKPKPSQLGQLAKWAEQVAVYPHLFGSHREGMGSYHYFRVQFLQIRDIEALAGKRSQYLQITASMYDPVLGSFAGSTYFSEMFEITSSITEKPSCQCKKSIYFYTSAEKTVLKVLVWRLQSQKNGKGIENMTKRVYLGCLDVKVGEDNQSGIIQKVLIPEQSNRFNIQSQYIKLDEDEEKSSSKKSIKAIFRIVNSHSLSHLHYFIPPNHIFDENDYILGLKNNKIGLNGDIQLGERHRLRFDIALVSLPQSSIKYLFQIAEAKVNSNYSIIGRANINFKQVRLNVQFHNGWKSVAFESLLLKQLQFQSALLENRRQSIKNTKSNNKIKQTSNKSKSFFFDKQKQLKAAFYGGALLLWLQVKLQIKFDIPSNQSKKSKTEILYLPLGFTIKPLPQKVDEQLKQKFQFKLGNPFNLSNLHNYLLQKKISKKQQIEQWQNKLYCDLTLYLQKANTDIDNIETVQQQANEIEMLRLEKQRLGRLRRKIKDEKRKKLIELNEEIPFLDTNQLKQQLYEQRLAKIRSEKQEQSEMIFFLKAKLGELQRQALKNEFNKNNESDDSDEQSNHILKIKKMPNNFIDYRAQTQIQSHKAEYFLNCYNDLLNQHSAEIKQIQLPLIQTATSLQTFLQMKIISFEAFMAAEAYSLVFPCLEQRRESLSFTINDYENKEIEMKIPSSKQLAKMLLFSLLNGYFCMELHINRNKRIKSFALIHIGQLIEDCSNGDLYSIVTRKLKFQNQHNLIAYMTVQVAFTHNKLNNNDPYSNQSPQKGIQRYNEHPNKQFEMINRINRFKKSKGEIEDNKMLIVNKAISFLQITKKQIVCKQNEPCNVHLTINNLSNRKQQFSISIFDQDSNYLEKQEISIQPYQANTQSKQLIINLRSKTFQLNAHESGQLILTYMSKRANINIQSILLKQSEKQTLLKFFNHKHRISVQITNIQTKVIKQRLQIAILPIFQFNTIRIEKFVCEKQMINIAFMTNQFEIIPLKKDIIISASKIGVQIPLLNNSETYLTQVSLRKNSSLGLVTAQNIQIICFGCQKFEIEGRLWESKDILLKLPFSAIISQQATSKEIIEEISVFSKHSDVRIKQLGDFQYSSHVKINRKSNQILVRAQVSLNCIGSFSYGVQIAHKDRIFHRVGIFGKLPFPQLLLGQIIALKIPTQNIQQPQPFNFKNPRQIGSNYEIKTNRPDLLRFLQSRIFLKSQQQWKIQMKFHWLSIRSQLEKEERSEISILIGIISLPYIDYFLFKCKL